MRSNRLAGLSGVGTLLAMLAFFIIPGARGGVIRAVGIEAFSEQSIFESFEGLTAGENIEAVPASDLYLEDGTRRTGADGDGFLRPGVSGPYVFPSGIVLTAPIPNTRESGSSQFIGDFSLGAARFFGSRPPIIDSVANVPDGTAYLAASGRDLRFELPVPAYRFGFVVSRAVLGVRLYDDIGVLITQAQVTRADLSVPFLGFEHDTSFRSVEFYYPGGPRVVGASRYIVDRMVADAVPEPSGLLFALCGIGCAMGRRGRRVIHQTSKVL